MTFRSGYRLCINGRLIVPGILQEVGSALGPVHLPIDDVDKIFFAEHGVRFFATAGFDGRGKLIEDKTIELDHALCLSGLCLSSSDFGNGILVLIETRFPESGVLGCEKSKLGRNCDGFSFPARPAAAGIRLGIRFGIRRLAFGGAAHDVEEAGERRGGAARSVRRASREYRFLSKSIRQKSSAGIKRDARRSCWPALEQRGTSASNLAATSNPNQPAGFPAARTKKMNRFGRRSVGNIPFAESTDAGGRRVSAVRRRSVSPSRAGHIAKPKASRRSSSFSGLPDLPGTVGTRDGDLAANETLVSVAVRVRPFNAKEVATGAPTRKIVTVLDDGQVVFDPTTTKVLGEDDETSPAFRVPGTRREKNIVYGFDRIFVGFDGRVRFTSI